MGTSWCQGCVFHGPSLLSCSFPLFWCCPPTGPHPDTPSVEWQFFQAPRSSPILHLTSQLPHCRQISLGEVLAHSWRTVSSLGWSSSKVTSQPFFLPVRCSSASALRKSDILLWSIRPSKWALHHKWLSILFPNLGRQKTGRFYPAASVTMLVVAPILTAWCCRALSLQQGSALDPRSQGSVLSCAEWMLPEHKYGQDGSGWLGPEGSCVLVYVTSTALILC